MSRRITSCAAATILAMTACAPAPPATYEPPATALRSSRLALTGESLIVAHAASGTVTKIRTSDAAVMWSAALGCAPVTLAIAPPGTVITCSDTGELVLLDDAGHIRRRRAVGHGAFGVVFAGQLYVTLTNANALLALDPTTLAEIRRTSTARAPRGLALEDDVLYVIHERDASIRRFAARDLRPLGTIEIGQQAGVAESLTAHPSKPRLFVPHTRLNVTNLARQFDSTVFPVVASVDLETGTVVRRETLSLDSVDSPVGMPLAVAIDPARGWLYSANAASDDVSVVDLSRGIGVGHIDVGERPREIVLSIDGSRAYTLDEQGATVTVIDTGAMKAAATIRFASDPRPADVREGARFFTTSRPRSVAKDRWISCSTCHLDGGADGQTWLGTDQGPRNTPSLRGIAGTGPFHWSGDRPDIPSFQKTFTGLMAGTGLTDDQLRSLTAFIETLRPIPSPRRKPDGTLSRAAESGAAVFRRAGCGACHSGPRFTDRQLHSVGTGEPSGAVPELAGPAFKTPALRELWATAPYLHDGRAPTLRDAIGKHTSAQLSAQEVSDLEAFLLQLPLTDAEYARLLGR